VGYDWILVDLQHGMAHESGLGSMLPAIEAAGAAPLVRGTSRSGPEIGRVLDLGAWAVVVPMVDSADEAAAAVAATRFGTYGTRSYGPIRGRAIDSDLPRCLVMIETAAGLASVDEICSVPELLGVLVGPGDLALGLGLAVDYEVGKGLHHEAIARVGDAARAAGVVAAIQTAGADEARLRVEQGFTPTRLPGLRHRASGACG
jgi:4-hydroxy-2-oxoheptanedioate aldolase